MKKITLILMIMVLCSQIQAQSYQVFHLDQDTRSLEELWSKGVQKGDSLQTDYWIGYSIIRKTSRHTSISTHHSEGNRPQLQQILYGEYEQYRNDLPDSGDSEQILNEMAILMQFERDGELKDVKISEMESQIKLKQLPVIWLGARDDQEESFNLQKQLYSESKIQDVREDLIVFISLHQKQPEVKDFLIGIIENEKNQELREEAVFWLGQQELPGVADYLYNLAQNDADGVIREKAVFALSQIDTDQAIDYVIDLAKNAKDMEVREQAIFWLGQIASEKSLSLLEDIVYEENETELKAQAVFALSQLPDNEGVSPLIKIAKEHENMQVRKKAIFWLGQSDDPRALEVIISIIKNN